MPSTPANSLNISQAGLQNFDGTSNFTGVPFSTTAAANTVAEWDANKNLNANNFLSGFLFYNTASNQVLTVASAQNQVYGFLAAGKTVTLPDTTTLQAGWEYHFNNNSGGSITIKDNGGAVLDIIPAGGFLSVICTTNSNPSGTWDKHFGLPDGTGNQILITNTVGDPVYLSPSSTAGAVLQSAGASAIPAYSTASYPTVATGTGKLLRADGTNWVPTTATYPDTAGTSGNFLKSDGTNFVSSAPPAVSGLVKISTQSANTTSTISFTTGITATYNNYMLVINNYRPATNATNLVLQISTDGGLNYIATNYASGNTYTAFNGSTNTNHSITSGFLLLSTEQNASNCGSAIIYLLNMTSGSGFITHSSTLSFSATDSGFATGTGAGIYTIATTTVNAIQIASSSGDMTTGNFTLYGMLT